jgi:hypothetical protein
MPTCGNEGTIAIHIRSCGDGMWRSECEGNLGGQWNVVAMNVRLVLFPLWLAAATRESGFPHGEPHGSHHCQNKNAIVMVLIILY